MTKEQKLITESWIQDEEIYGCLTNSLLLIDFVRSQLVEFPQDFELVLDVERIDDSEPYWCGYYYVAHSARSIFWLEKNNVSEYFIEGGATGARLSEFGYYHYCSITTLTRWIQNPSWNINTGELLSLKLLA